MLSPEPRSVGRNRGRGLIAAAVAVTTAACAALPPGTGASTAPAPVVVTTGDELAGAHPRILLRASDVAVVQARANREPYRTLFARMHQTIAAAPPANAADQSNCGLTANIGREEAKARAAKDLAFMYAVDRTWDPITASVVDIDESQRAVLGDRARAYLVAMCVTSRIRIQPDRDINTANEMTQMATAFDTLAGAGYDLATDRAVIVDNLTRWARDFYSDYQPFLVFLTNNHLTKGAAAIGTAALALLAEPNTDPHELDTWLDFALHNIQQTVRYTLGSDDGTYGEGPFYWRYASQNVLPFARAYDSLSGSRAWRTRSGEIVANIWTAGWFSAIGRWMIDMTRPDGTLAPLDDGNTDDAYYFGLLSSTSKYASAYAWRWANTATTSASVPYESGGNVDLSADQIVTFDDHIQPAPPVGSTHRVSKRTGTMVLRSDWSANAVVAFVQAEHGGARGFGRTPQGVGVPFVAVHDHADPGAFMLDAYGERLLLDPGYINYTYTLHGILSDPSAHNMILVSPATDPQSPGNPNTATTVPNPLLDAFTTVAGSPVPVDGEAFITNPINRHNVAGATITSRYGRATQPSGPLSWVDFLETDGPDAATVQRRFLMIDRRYLVMIDHVTAPTPRTITWPMHGNGGGADGVTTGRAKLNSFDKMFEPAAALPPTAYISSGGTFASRVDGGTWTRSNARVQTAMAFIGATTNATLSTSLGFHEAAHGQLASHDVLSTSVFGSDVLAASVVYPSPTSAVEPTISTVTSNGIAMIRVDDAARDHHVFVVLSSDALAVVDLRNDGSLASVHSEPRTN